MSIIFRTDSDGNEFQVWAQRQAASCAVACLWMAESLAMQMTLAEGEWEKAWKLYEHTVNGTPWIQSSSINSPTGPMSIDPRVHQNNQSTFYNQFSNFGTYAKQVVAVLRQEGLTVTTSAAPSGTLPLLTLNTSNISPTTPAIILLGWYAQSGNSWQRNGGHFIVAVRTNSSGQMVYLDPWQGVLNESANNGRYQQNGYIEQALYVSQ